MASEVRIGAPLFGSSLCADRCGAMESCNGQEYNFPFQMGTARLLTYSLTCTLLCLNLLLLWIASGVARARAGGAINPEDGVRFNTPVSDRDPPTVARILRAHRNAEAVIYPFLLLGLLYVLAGGSVALAAPIFAVFVIARFAHT